MSPSSGKLHGFWGYEPFAGPNFDLRSAHAGEWSVAEKDKNALIIGRDDMLHLQSDNATCVEDIILRDQHGKEIQATWKLLKPEALEVRIPLQEASPGPVSLLLKQSGVTKPDEIALQAYSEAAHLESFAINAGDREGVLTGTRLDKVAGLDLHETHFIPVGLTRVNEMDELRLLAPNASAPDLEPGQKMVASVTLTDGRVLQLPTTIKPPRPKVTFD